MKKVLKRLQKNWKTTLTGFATIIVSLLVSKGKIDAASGAAITAGIALTIADDPKSEIENK